VQDLAELREYCYYVAGVVGEMLCEMMADYLRQPPFTGLCPLAVDLGTGLQLVNILKDAPKDADHDRRYLPPADAGDTVRDRVLTEARRCLQRGVEYVLALPAHEPGLRRFCGLPIAWGGLTLRHAGRAVSAGKITRSAIGDAIETFSELAEDDDALRAWLTSIIAPAPSDMARTASQSGESLPTSRPDA
jgi:farnesyl-diphosphate farnesyltransferase